MLGKDFNSMAACNALNIDPTTSIAWGDAACGCGFCDVFVV
jgi:hypothetical protein